MRLRMTNKIPDDQEISGITHLLDHADFIRQARVIFGQRFPEHARLGPRFEDRQARNETFAGDGLEITVDGLSIGNLEVRKRILDRVNLYVAALRDRHRPFQRFGDFAKHLRHFFRGLEEKLVGGKFHAVRVAHRLPGLDAEQHFLRMRIGMLQIMAIVGSDKRNAGLARETHNFRVDAFLDFQALVLNFQEEVPFSENVAQAVSRFSGLIRAFFHQVLGDGAAQARRQCN